MQKLKYNGWTNYETWNFKLWADNDEPTYKKVQSLIKEVLNTRTRVSLFVVNQKQTLPLLYYLIV
jgi:hypothetical protein